MLLKIILKCFFVYFIVLVSLKFMGKREIGQVSLFDFAIILIISDILVIGIEEDNKHFWHYLLGVILLTITQRLIAYVILKFRKLRLIFDGRESVIIYEGKLNVKEMSKQRYNMDDLITQIRLKDISSLSEIKYLILENNGMVSIYKKEDNPINPLPLIISGEIEYDNLKLLNIKEEWLNLKLKEKNILLKDVYFASFENDDLFIVPLYKVDNENKKQNSNYKNLN